MGVHYVMYAYTKTTPDFMSHVRLLYFLSNSAHSHMHTHDFEIVLWNLIYFTPV